MALQGTKATIDGTGTNSIKFGQSAVASSVNSIALGVYANATGDNSISIGSNSYSWGSSSIAIGTQTYSTGGGSVAIGPKANAPYSDGIAIGHSANERGMGIVIGSGANSHGSRSVAIGYHANIISGEDAYDTEYAITIGYYATAQKGSTNSIIIGTSATAYAVGDIAIGKAANVNRTYSTGLGYQVNINTSHSVNCMMLGGTSQTNIYHYGTLRSQSDINDKIDISEIPNGATELFKQLTPIEYYYNYRDEYIEPEEWSEQEIETIDELGNTQKEIIQVCNLSKEEQEKRKKYGQGTYNKEAWQQGLKKHTDLQVGLSAQELLQALENIYGDSRAFPLVGDNFDNFELEEGEEIPEDIEHRYNIAYINLIPFLIKSIKELDARITELEREKGEN